MDHSRIAANQQRTFLVLWAGLRPHVRTDSALPRRIKDLLGRNRSLGSRDRRLYRELIYTAIRFLPWVEERLESDPAGGSSAVAWLAPELPATAPYRSVLCADWPATPGTMAEKSAVLATRLGGTFAPASLLPDWFREHCPAVFSSPHLEAINERASLWVRLQCRDSSVVLDEFRFRGWNARPDPEVPDAFSLPPDAEVAATDAYRRGFVEIQDLGSQLVLRHAAVAAGENWLDACAGAGGKTLQLARLVGETGRVDACDIRGAMLDELQDRSTRARLGNVRILTQPGSGYQGVLVDAPCSGTGTWRRMPHMKWYTQPAMIAQFRATQLSLLGENAPRVAPGGQLVYATCSLSSHENQSVVTEFLGAHPNFAPEPALAKWGAVPGDPGQTLLPGTRNTDGFYVAVLRRKS